MNHYALFAQILDYPTSRLIAALDEAIARLQGAQPEAAGRLTNFKADCERIGLGRLEEIYAGTFDLQADCSLHAGYHLFGDDWRRSLFLAELQGRYQAAGFSCGSELPDHLTVIARFLSVQRDPEEESALRDDCLRPAAEKVAARLNPTLNPYRAVLDAWLSCLAAGQESVESRALERQSVGASERSSHEVPRSTLARSDAPRCSPEVPPLEETVP